MQKSTHTPEYAALCNELRAARKSAGLSLRDLVALLDVPHSWVANVESGERRIDFVEFVRFLAACGADATAVSARLIATIARHDGRHLARRRRTK